MGAIGREAGLVDQGASCFVVGSHPDHQRVRAHRAGVIGERCKQPGAVSGAAMRRGDFPSHDLGFACFGVGVGARRERCEADHRIGVGGHQDPVARTRWGYHRTSPLHLQIVLGK